MPNALIDAGPFIALFDRSDQHHEPVKEFFRNFSGRLYCTWPVITEASYMLGFNIHAQTDFLKWLNHPDIYIFDLDKTHVLRMADLMTKYRDIGMDLADSSLLVVSENLQTQEIITIDSDFTVFRTKGKKRLNNLLKPYL